MPEIEKTETYHESAIQYNDYLAKAAGEVAELVEDKTVAKWCRSIQKQHEFHSHQHELALQRMREKALNTDIEIPASESAEEN